MSVSDGAGTVNHDQAHHRFIVTDGDAVAELTYRWNHERLVLVHTGVPPRLGGRGVGGRLVEAAVERAAAEGLTVVPLCPFARRWLRERPDVAKTITIDWSTREDH
ncbi:MAG: N-acetyltransferase [Candidatus Dormibacteraeota bacterium]|nr:N-acetyltransferase [Candidatus Dormibacteraeota bacterium]